MNGCYLVWSPLTVVKGWSEFCQKNRHQGAWRTCQGGVEDARNPVTEAVSDIESGATINYWTSKYSDPLLDRPHSNMFFSSYGDFCVELDADEHPP